MRIPLTKYGMPQVAYYPSLTGLLILLFLFLRPPFWYVIELILIAILVWLLSFFRDPLRIIANDPKNLLSPADPMTDQDLGLIVSLPRADLCELVVSRGPLPAYYDGLDLRASRLIDRDDRQQLERLPRYAVVEKKRQTFNSPPNRIARWTPQNFPLRCNA